LLARLTDALCTLHAIGFSVAEIQAYPSLHTATVARPTPACGTRLAACVAYTSMTVAVMLATYCRPSLFQYIWDPL
jgi:hypothetical protein